MDDYICCLLGICCAFDTPEQFDKLVSLMAARRRVEPRAAVEARVRKDLAWAREHRENWAGETK